MSGDKAIFNFYVLNFMNKNNPPPVSANPNTIINKNENDQQ